MTGVVTGQVAIEGDAEVLRRVRQSYLDLETRLYRYHFDCEAAYDESRVTGSMSCDGEATWGRLFVLSGPSAVNTSPPIERPNVLWMYRKGEQNLAFAEDSLTLTKMVNVMPELYGKMPSLPHAWMTNINGAPRTWASFFNQSEVRPSIGRIVVKTNSDERVQIEFESSANTFSVTVNPDQQFVVTDYEQSGQGKGLVRGKYRWEEIPGLGLVAVEGEFFVDSSTQKSEQPIFRWKITNGSARPQRADRVDWQSLEATPGVAVIDRSVAGARGPRIVGGDSPPAVRQRNLTRSASIVRGSILFSREAAAKFYRGN